MDPFLQKFKNLSRELREAVSSEEKIKFLEEIEKKYNLKLTKLVVRVMIKDIAWPDLENFLGGNFNLSPEKAKELKKDLAGKIFNEVLGYLGEDNRLKVSAQGGSAADGKDLSEGRGQDLRLQVKDLSFEQKTAATETQKQMEIDRNIFQPEVETKQAEIKKEKLDFKEIAQEAKNILTTITPLTSPPSSNLEKIIKEIKQKLNLVFEDEISEHRFENIIRSYFREVRNEVQTEETLRRAKKIGGLEFLLEKAALVIRIIKEFKNRIELGIRNKELGINNQGEKETMKPQKIATTEAQKPVLAEVSPFVKTSADKQPAVVKQIETNKNISQTNVGTKIVGITPLPAAKLAETKKPEAEKLKEPARADNEITKRFENGPIIPNFKKIEKPIDIKKPATAEAQKIPEPQKSLEIQRLQERPKENKRILIQIKQPISGEKLVEDINQGVRRAIGPVEELAEITPLDLQRWGGGENTTQIILDKINLLQEISLLKRAEGIHAWQRSSLLKLYLEIGREALEKRKSIQQLIREKENNHQPFLRIEDFEAINELNQKLRF